jgi:protein arginine kinase
MKINELIAAHSELTDAAAGKSAVVLMTRIRLARNLAGTPFPGWAKPAQKREESATSAARPSPPPPR